MVRNYQGNNFRIMFMITMLVIKFNFFDFVVKKSFWVASLKEPSFHFILTLNEVFFKITYPAQP